MDPEKSCCEECDNSCQDIVALKIFGQCKIQECESLGPVVSRENCECVILPPCEESENLGRIILPGCPITAPLCTTCVKIMKNSFCLENAEIVNICPSPLKKGYWCADILFKFEFTLQLFGIAMQPLKIVCCPTTIDEMKNEPKEKFWMKAGVSYRKQVMLYGGEKPPSVVYSNLFCGTGKFNDPYFLVQAEACSMDESLVDPCCLEEDADCCNPCKKPICPPYCGCCNPCRDAYCEPFLYIFVEICLAGTIKLVRMICREIKAKPCTQPKKCESCSEDPRKFFEEMKFPHELFEPKK